MTQIKKAINLTDSEINNLVDNHVKSLTKYKRFVFNKGTFLNIFLATLAFGSIVLFGVLLVSNTLLSDKWTPYIELALATIHMASVLTYLIIDPKFKKEEIEVLKSIEINKRLQSFNESYILHALWHGDCFSEKEKAILKSYLLSLSKNDKDISLTTNVELEELIQPPTFNNHASK